MEKIKGDVPEFNIEVHRKYIKSNVRKTVMVLFHHCVVGPYASPFPKGENRDVIT